MPLNYVISPCGKQLHDSDKFVKLLVGPYGSGKSTACAVDLLWNACAQPPAQDGVRYSRIGIIRATYPELSQTTRKTVLDVFPQECGTVTSVGAPLKGFYDIPLADGTRASIELTLVSMRNAEDEIKIRSANWTFAWINEATGVDVAVYSAVLQRVGRFPSADMGGVRWGGVILDFNMPIPGTWLDDYLRDPPDNAIVIRQPPAAFEIENALGDKEYAVNPDAENLTNLGAYEEGDPDPATLTPTGLGEYMRFRGMRYYRNQIDVLLKSGRNDVVQNQYCMMDVPIVEGKPVYTNFSMTRHVAKEEIQPIPFQPVIIGSDTSGIHPAAVVMQMQHGKWCVIDELYADGEGLEDFLYGMLLPLLRERYATCPVVASLDVADARDSWTAMTPSQRFEELGIQTVKTFSNSPKVRISSVEHMFNLDTGGILISPTCNLLVRACASEYRYRRLQASGTLGAVYTPQPEKNDASHIADSLQYACMYIMHDKDNDKDTTAVVERLASRRHSLRRVM